MAAKDVEIDAKPWSASHFPEERFWTMTYGFITAPIEMRSRARSRALIPGDAIFSSPDGLCRCPISEQSSKRNSFGSPANHLRSSPTTAGQLYARCPCSACQQPDDLCHIARSGFRNTIYHGGDQVG